jgi:hypothetical protein
MPKFPKTIYVTQETAANDDPWFVVHEDGPPNSDETQDCAVYELVKVGKVEVSRTFVEKKRR